MKSFACLITGLATASLAIAGPAQVPAVLGLGTPNALNVQDHLDPCGSTPQTKTMSYDAAYRLKDGACPAHYWRVDSVCLITYERQWNNSLWVIV